MSSLAPAPRIVGLGGTLRPQSSSAVALGAALQAAERAGAECQAFAGLEIEIPMYQPGATERDPKARRLVEAMREADGFIVSSPGYHGGISGLVKNALDYAEDLRDDPRPYWDGRAVGCIVTAYGHQAGSSVLHSLRSIAHALRAWPTPLGVAVNSSEPVIDDGRIVDELVGNRLEIVGQQVVEFAYRRTTPHPNGRNTTTYP